MKVKKISALIFLTLLGATLNGQVRQPHSLYFMETIPQILQMNPALQPRANGYIMLPNANIDLRGDLAAKDVLQHQGALWYTPFEKNYNYDKLYKSTGKKATMSNNAIDVDVIGFGFRTGNGYFSFGVSEHISANNALPNDLFKISENGFPNGTKLDFSSLGGQEIVYMQWRFGYSGKLNEKLSIGLNVKPLFGQIAVVSKIEKFDIHTGEEQWIIDAKGNIYSSAPIDVITNAEGKIDDIEDRDFSDYKTKDWINDYVTALNNPGIAFDFGAAYQVNERLTASASLNNLGFISWENDLNSISFNGKYEFKGIEYDATSDDKIEDLFKNLGDSIVDAMNYKVRNDKFKTPLAPVFHAGASYQLSRAASVGFLSRTVFWKNGVRQSFNTTFSLQPYSFVAMNVGATYQIKSNVYLGGGFTFLLGPLQIYFLADYIPVYYSTLRIIHNEKPVEILDRNEISIPERMKTFTFNAGINLVFGRHGYINRPMLDKGKSSWN